MQSIIWVRYEAVIKIHRHQLTEHGGLDGIRNQALLESALNRPKNLLAYSESPPDISALAAAYAYGLTTNHPFVDGNKRTAYVVTRSFLILNGYDLEASEEATYQTWMDLAASRLSEEELAIWIRERIFPYGG
jgi:death on curing protein